MAKLAIIPDKKNFTGKITELFLKSKKRSSSVTQDKKMYLYLQNHK